MKTTAVFDDIIATCTLVRMRGIIPSLLEYQYQLKQRIERLCGDLQKKDYNADALDALCRLTCLVVDLNTRQSLEAQGVSWRGYELEHVFYGFGRDPLFTEQHAALLFEGKNDELAFYAQRLFSLSPLPLPGCAVNQALTVVHSPATTDAPPAVVTTENVIEPESKEKISRKPLWMSLVKQATTLLLLLSAVWSLCWLYLQEGM